uniref:G-protein coupled receptors family 3 profile domain-containing protein n=1 Tax=Loxodonta africana TaxID=9785 RepID=G3UJI0_LOXAF
NSERDHCLPKAVAFLTFEDPLVTAVACTALPFSTLTGYFTVVLVKYRDTPIVKANWTLSYVLLTFLSLCFLCSFLFIGCPNTATCILWQTTFGVVFTVVVSSVLAKIITPILAFKATVAGRRVRHWLVSGSPNSFHLLLCPLLRVTVCGVWLRTSPPFTDTDIHSEPGFVLICSKGLVTAFSCVLGYLGSLALGSFTVAFPVYFWPSSVKPAKYLTFTMLVFCSVWVNFLPVYHSTKGKVMVAVEISTLASSAWLLGCIFAPKCYIIILLRPDKNTLKEMRNKTGS